MNPLTHPHPTMAGHLPRPEALEGQFAAGEVAVNDYIFRRQTKGLLLTGVRGWNPMNDTDAALALFGATRSVDVERLSGLRYLTPSGSYSSTILDAMGYAKNLGASLKHLYMNPVSITKLSDVERSKTTREEINALGECMGLVVLAALDLVIDDIAAADEPLRRELVDQRGPRAQRVSAPGHAAARCHRTNGVVHIGAARGCAARGVAPARCVCVADPHRRTRARLAADAVRAASAAGRADLAGARQLDRVSARPPPVRAGGGLGHALFALRG